MTGEQAKIRKLGKLRTNLLRLAYVPLAVGLAIFQLPMLAEIGPEWEIMHGVVVCMLSALCLLSIIGLFRPVTMLPILLFEVVWKILWLGLVGLPAWISGSATSDIMENLFACALVLPIIALIPWDHVSQALWAGSAPGDDRQAVTN